MRGSPDGTKQGNTVVTEKTQSSVSPAEYEARRGLKQKIQHLTNTLWIWELASLLLSTLCVGAVMVMLFYYDNKPLPDWRYGLTINGVISTLSVVAKSAVILPVAEAISQLKWYWYWGRLNSILDFQLLDAASRGPVGSLLWLCRPKKWSIVTIGTMITVAAMFMEPSLQLMLSYSVPSVRAGKSSIPSSTYYKDIIIQPHRDNGHQDNTVALGTNTIRSFWAGLYGSNDSVLVRPVCPTGNCTWPSFSSLGVCSACANLTTELIYRPPSSLNAEASWELPRLYQGLSNLETGAAHGVFEDGLPSLRFSQNENSNVFDMYYFTFDDRHKGSMRNGSWIGPQVRAFECAMYFCVRTYSAKVTDGVFNEEVVTAWPSVNDSILNTPNFSHAPEGPGLGTSDKFKYMNYTLKPPARDVSFAVDTRTMYVMKQWLTVVPTNLYYDGSSGTETQDAAQVFYDAQWSNVNGSEQFTGPGPVFERIANAMSTTIRKAAGVDFEVEGSALRVQTYVVARWRWSTLPIGLLATTFLFMVTTILLTVHRDVPIWKSSTLATLVHGLDENTREHLSARDLDSVEAKAKDFNMTMSVDRSRSRLEGSLR